MTRVKPEAVPQFGARLIDCDILFCDECWETAVCEDAEVSACSGSKICAVDSGRIAGAPNPTKSGVES